MKENPQAMMNMPHDRLVAHAYGYHTPTQRQWVGLTEEEILKLWNNDHDRVSFARAIEAKLRSKNGY
jgi:hypothetical protein